MIQPPAVDLYSSPYGAVPFAVLAVVLLGGAVVATGADKGLPVPVRGGLAATLLGLCVAMSYEAFAVWQRNPSHPTISRIANDAFAQKRYLWGAIFLVVILVGGLLTMQFTRVVQRPQSAQWNLLITAVLFLLNGAVIAYWFNWLP